jgi:hypothetical protein
MIQAENHCLYRRHGMDAQVLPNTGYVLQVGTVLAEKGHQSGSRLVPEPERLLGGQPYARSHSESIRGIC